MRFAFSMIAALPLALAPATAGAQSQTYTSQGQPAQAQGAPTQQDAPISRTKHGKWEVLCFKDGLCIMTQVHTRTEQTADAVFTLVKPRGLTDNSGQPVTALAEIVVPLGVFLANGLGLQIDGQEPLALPFERCIPAGCVARAPVSDVVISQMKAGATANIILWPDPRANIGLPLSLTGFTAAYNSF